jgi:hypothetical protein
MYVKAHVSVLNIRVDLKDLKYNACVSVLDNGCVSLTSHTSFRTFYFGGDNGKSPERSM